MTRCNLHFALFALVALLACAYAQSEATTGAVAPEQTQQQVVDTGSPTVPAEPAVTIAVEGSKPEVTPSSPSTSPAVEVMMTIQPTAVHSSPVETTGPEPTVPITAVPVSAVQPKPASPKPHTRADAGSKPMQCAPGQRLSRANKVLSCQPCLPGHFQDKRSSAGRCKMCPAGTYASAKGSRKCKKCSKGKVSTAGQRACVIRLGGSSKQVPKQQAQKQPQAPAK